VIDILFVAGALLITAIIGAVQYGTDSRDGYTDDHKR
jgi:hypothetical protein